MINVVFSILLLLSYLAFVIYIMKGGNLLMGFIMMSVVWIPVGVIGGQIDWDTFNGTIMQTAPSNIGSNVVLIFIGSWLGQVLLKTGIASTIIKKAVELGGDKPLLTAIILSVLTTLIFCSAYGAGAVIGIGVIVLPIMLSLGIPKAVATASYIMSVGAGMYSNAVIFSEKQAVLLLNETNPEYTYQVYQQVGIVATVVQLVIIILMLATTLGRKKQAKVHSWAAPTAPAVETDKKVPFYSLIAPFLPVVLIIAFGWNSLPAFLAAIFYALATCGYMKNFSNLADTISRSLFDGIMDAAPLIGFLFFQGIFTAAANADAFFFQETIGGIIPASTLALAIVFAVLTPLGLFRGPMSVFGVGPVTFAVINGLGIFSVPFLFALFQFTGIATTISSCPTQSWTIWAINYNKVTTTDFMRLAFPWCWVANIINLAILYVRIG
ncbi:MAG TPA: citrate transporter [Candidatus Ruthenibacterium merdigallinarum]|nr:citrate transporter [Candidatus Ruthenibacterium merdigallinarum]